MKPLTNIERRELEDKINAAAGGADISHPLPGLFINTFGDNPAFDLSPDQFDDAHFKQYALLGAKIKTDSVVCACPCQPFVDWAVFAWNEDADFSCVLHRFRLN